MGERAHDQGYVAAPPAAVYGALRDPASYDRWWPRVRSGRVGEGASLKVGRGRPMGVRTERHREGVGLVLRLEGSPAATLEWYLEPFREGTIVNCILDVEAGRRRRARQRVRRLRAAVRRGMVGLKGALE